MSLYSTILFVHGVAVLLLTATLTMELCSSGIFGESYGAPKPESGQVLYRLLQLSAWVFCSQFCDWRLSFQQLGRNRNLLVSLRHHQRPDLCASWRPNGLPYSRNPKVRRCERCRRGGVAFAHMKLVS
jgi:hypothetical protein